MPLPQIWRRRKASGRIQPTHISLPIPIPESEIPPCFAPVSTPKATMLASARPIFSSINTTTSTANVTTMTIAPVPPQRPTRLVSRCAPCSCMPGFGLEEDLGEAERSHVYSCSLVEAACAYAAATVGSEYVSLEERRARMEEWRARVEEQEAALAGRRAALEAKLQALQDGELTLESLPEVDTPVDNVEIPVADPAPVDTIDRTFNIAKRSSAYASSIATTDSRSSTASTSTSTSTPTLSHSTTSTPNFSHSTTCFSSTDSLGPMTPYDVYDDPFAGPEGWEPADEEKGVLASLESTRDAFADLGRYAEVGRYAEAGRGSAQNQYGSNFDIITTPGPGGVASVLRVMEKGGGQAMLDANAHWSQKYRQTVAKSVNDRPPPLIGGVLERSEAGTLFTELSEASKEYGWSLDLDLLTPRAEPGGQRLPIHTFFTKHYWTPEYS
ncbi:uncharacterized protein SCHCODRAFT_02508258 [Schizophyllum commune H4-8]|uniref:Uncharacterized protein n=1 Tax=Schizophyllum commune (strain H4-8 / FGSC 9210) TaxID=578458 RepID=D8Q9W1_SCHCM|nr:uncharacterized protein SCHCODRAFT_02508258 [Schizophyllum commune H4-8]KAI5890262.1 hypothetical protein SCHCODRAFT_02508258 [Schizophyllum commune H4-8]